MFKNKCKLGGVQKINANSEVFKKINANSEVFKKKINANSEVFKIVCKKIIYR